MPILHSVKIMSSLISLPCFRFSEIWNSFDNGRFGGGGWGLIIIFCLDLSKISDTGKLLVPLHSRQRVLYYLQKRNYEMNTILLPTDDGELMTIVIMVIWCLMMAVIIINPPPPAPPPPSPPLPLPLCQQPPTPFKAVFSAKTSVWRAVTKRHAAA